MPRTDVLFYREDDGTVPLLEWLAALQPRAVVKCRVRLERLAELGHELRRPVADYLRDGIYELRVPFGSINYRILYFYHGRNAVVVSHGLSKEAKVPRRDIVLAVERKRHYEACPDRHRAR